MRLEPTTQSFIDSSSGPPLSQLTPPRRTRSWPGRASVDDLRELPDALIIVDGDILRDEGEAYADLLSEAGVRVTSVRYNETIHDFAMLNPLASTPATRAAIQQSVDALKAALA
jgi:acetyl esterase